MEIGINLVNPEKRGYISFEEQIKLLLENGFNHTFCVPEKDAPTDDIFKKAKSEGLIFDFLHIPFRGVNDLYFEGEEGEIMLSTMLTEIQKCATYEIPTAVVHLSSGNTPPLTDLGIERFCKIMEFSRKIGVKIAFENLRTLGNLAFTLERYSDALFCWDVGHEHCFTSGIDFMSLFGNRLGALHIHDNHCERNKDEHMVPFDGGIDFDRIALKLSEVNFNGTVMLEVIKNFTSYYDNMSFPEFYKHASNAANKLKNLIEAKKTTLQEKSGK